MTDDFQSQDSFHVLKKLQEQMRSNIPAMIAQRAMSSFSLQQEPPPDRAFNTVFVVVLVVWVFKVFGLWAYLSNVTV